MLTNCTVSFQRIITAARQTWPAVRPVDSRQDSGHSNFSYARYAEKLFDYNF